MSDPTALRAARVDPAPAPAPPEHPRRAKRAAGSPKASPRPGVRQGNAAGAIGRAWRRLAAPLRARALVAWERFAPVRTKVGGWLAVVSPLGWTMIAGTALAWFLAVRFGWAEFGYVAAVLFIVLVLSALFTIGRLRVSVDLVVDPLRVRVGESAAAQLHLRNSAATPLLPIGVEFPVGAAVARYATPVLRPGGEYEELALIPTERRGVVELGPVTSQRGDPFGVFRRELAWTDRLELFVHPRTVPLEPLGAGLLRDLEGQTTNEVSMSDLAFHTLREYVPGDDRRYIHWRSSAKASAASGAGTFMVRQFLDTRRSHVAVVVDVNPQSYRTPEEFEVAISAAASVAVRAITDEMDLSIVCGDHAVVQPAPHVALDTFSRAELSDWTLNDAAAKLARLAPDASVVLLATGPLTSFATLQLARAVLAPEVHTIALRVDEGAATTLKQASGLPVLGIGALSDLPRVLAGGSLQ